MKRTWRAMVAGAAIWALAAGILSAQALSSYAWYAQVAAVDEQASSIKVTTQTREAVRLYIGDYMPGDKLMLVWVPIEGESDTVLYAPKYETMEGIEQGYILPVDFVSADLDTGLLTFQIPVSDSVLSSIASVQPGDWIKVITPMQQAQDVPRLASAERAEKPDLKPPPKPWELLTEVWGMAEKPDLKPPPKPEPEPTADGADAPAGEGLTGTWAVEVETFVAGNLVDYECTWIQQDFFLAGRCGGPLGDAEATGMVSENEVSFQFSLDVMGIQMDFIHVGALEGDAVEGKVTVYGGTSDFTATRK